MYFKPNAMRTMLGMTKVQYQSSFARGLLACTYQSRKSGMHSKFTEQDAIRNLLFAELIACGIAHSKSSEIAHTLLIGEGCTVVSKLSIDMGTICKLEIPMKEITKRINYDDGVT